MNNLKLQKLTPTDKVNMKAYEESFEFIFSNRDICNVAISGPYGSGKSSVLETYKKEHDEKKFYHVFLTHFLDTAVEANQQDKQGSKEERNEQTENTLEGKIINQIIQQIPPEDVPQTAFNVKRHTKFNLCLCITIGVAIVVLGLMYLFGFDTWNSWVNSINDEVLSSFLSFTRSNWTRIVVAIIVFCISGYGVYSLLRWLMNRNILRKISFLGNEIEIFSNNEDSRFDRYLNEILYLFENADIDAVVFEDIDRFDDVLIFERLREINHLINIRRRKSVKSKGKKKKDEGRSGEVNSEVKFFYLLRDDIFSTKDRTKFFDFILPIVPVVDGSNSYNKFKEYLEDTYLWEKLDHRFLRNFSLYIDDLRIIKNIVNEFMIFSKKLEGIELDSNKMLAMIIYKNIFPRDYADLQIRQGYVFNIFDQSNKEKYREQVKDKNREHKSELDEQIKQLDSEIQGSRQEHGQETDIYRKKENLEDELSQCESEYNKIDNMKIFELIGIDPDLEIIRDPVESDFNYDKIRFNEFVKNDYFPLLKFLLKNGYIDETYSDYMTYFYPDSLTNTDKIFLRSVFDRTKKDSNYHLDNVELVFEYLKPSDFVQPAILNYDLIDYLISAENNKDCLSKIVWQIQKTNDLKFFASYYQATTKKDQLVVIFNELWPEIFSVMYDEEDFDVQKILHSYSFCSLLRSSQDILKKMNEGEKLSSYVSSQSDYLVIDDKTINDTNKETLILSLRTIGVKFISICTDKCDPKLLEEVYQLNLYEMNANNLGFFLNQKYDDFDFNQEESLAQTLTILFGKQEEPLYNYFTQDPASGLSAVLKITTSRFCDDESVVISILNDIGIPADLRKEYLSRNKTVIHTLSSIKDAPLYPELLGRKTVARTADNIFQCYLVSNELSEDLVAIINSSSEKLDYTNVKISDEKKRNFVQACLKSEDLDESQFCEIVSQLGDYCNKSVQKGCCERKIAILAQNNKMFSMNLNNLNCIRTNYPGALKAFICGNFKGYINIVKSTPFSKETQEVLSWGEISKADRLFLLSQRSDSLSVTGYDYPEEIILEILKRHLKENDLPYLYLNYDEYSEDVQDMIFKLAKPRVSNSIPKTGQKMSFHLLNRLISENIDVKIKATLIKLNIADLSFDELIAILNSMGMDIIASALKSDEEVLIPADQSHRIVLDMLKEEGLISDFINDKNSENFWLVHKNSS